MVIVSVLNFIYWMETPFRGKQSIHSSFKPLSPNSDQHQIFPCNINAYSTPKVVRIKDMITKGEFS